ncbi:MAG: hypothetical protein EA355_03080, partial [Rhodobacteraceae bacterium]
MKPAAGLADRRVLEKLEIERRYWVGRGVDWGIVTQRDLPPVLIQNLTWLAGPWARDEWKSGDVDRVGMPEEALSTDGNVTFGEFCAAVDRRPGMDSGVTIGLIRRLVSTKRWATDLSIMIFDPAQPMSRFRIVSSEAKKVSVWSSPPCAMFCASTTAPPIAPAHPETATPQP